MVEEKKAGFSPDRCFVALFAAKRHGRRISTGTLCLAVSLMREDREELEGEQSQKVWCRSGHRGGICWSLHDRRERKKGRRAMENAEEKTSPDQAGPPRVLRVD